MLRCPGKLICTLYCEIIIMKCSQTVPNLTILSTTGGLKWNFIVVWWDRCATKDVSLINFFLFSAILYPFKSFGGQHCREQSKSEAYPYRTMEWFTQPIWQEEDRKLPCGAEKCWQYLLVQCSHTGGHKHTMYLLFYRLFSWKCSLFNFFAY